MKRVIALMLVLALTAIFLPSCSDKNDTSDTDFSFKSGDVVITPNSDAGPVIEALGDYVSYDESASCAFEGLDKVYKYNGFEILTYPKDSKDYIYTVTLLNDLVSTPEGVSVGMSRNKVIEVYGENYTSQGEGIYYSSENSQLQFIFRDGNVSSIKYQAVLK